MTDILNNSTDNIWNSHSKNNLKRGRRKDDDEEETPKRKKNKSTFKKKLPPTLKNGEFASFEDVPWHLTACDPDIYFEFANENTVHAAMWNSAVLPDELTQGSTPAASLTNLKAW
jgi:hypothetical protein